MIPVRVDKIEALAREKLSSAGVYGAGADRVLSKARQSSAAWLEPSARSLRTPEQEIEARLCAAFLSVAMLHAVIEAQSGELRPMMMRQVDD